MVKKLGPLRSLRYRQCMKTKAPALILIIVTFCPCAAGGEINQLYRAWFGAMIGQHFLSELNPVGIYPLVEFRSGLKIDNLFTTRLVLGTAVCRVMDPPRESFDDAGLFAGHASLGLLFTPRLAEWVTLDLGGALGVWFTAMWGDDLLDTRLGSVKKYLESTSVSLAAIVGFEFDVSDRWALVVETRYNRAVVNFGGREYNSGGIGLMAGFIYRVRVPGLLED